MDRVKLIQRLIITRRYRRYLEIGCQRNSTFSKIDIEEKVGIDSARGGTLRMTSDEFFSLAVTKFDLIFIDGDHRHDQVFRDVSNSLRLLEGGGVIVMHDCLPPSRDYESNDLCGTTWRAFVKIRERPDLDAMTLDADFGLGIVHIRPNTDPIYVGKPMKDLSYADFTHHRKDWMRPHNAAAIERVLELKPLP